MRIVRAVCGRSVMEKEVKCPSTNKKVVVDSGVSVHEDDKTACHGRGEILHIIPVTGNWVSCHVDHDTGEKVHNHVVCWALVQRCDGKKTRGLVAVGGSIDWIDADPKIACGFVDYHKDDEFECMR